jgi:hypothetical protein
MIDSTWGLVMSAVGCRLLWLIVIIIVAQVGPARAQDLDQGINAPLSRRTFF